MAVPKRKPDPELLGGLPGSLTKNGLGLNLPPGLTYAQVEHGLRLLGDMGRSVAFWAGDLLLYADTRFGEAKFSQLADALGWAPHTLQNALTVARSWPAGRRRAALDFGHHAALAHLEEEDQEHWAGLAEAGEKLPNGEVKRWSVSKLREALKALNPKKEKSCTPKTGPDAPLAKTSPSTDTLPVEPNATKEDIGPSEGRRAILLQTSDLIRVHEAEGRFKVVGIYASPGEVIIKAVTV